VSEGELRPRRQALRRRLSPRSPRARSGSVRLWSGDRRRQTGGGGAGGSGWQSGRKRRGSVGHAPDSCTVASAAGRYSRAATAPSSRAKRNWSSRAASSGGRWRWSRPRSCGAWPPARWPGSSTSSNTGTPTAGRPRRYHGRQPPASIGSRKFVPGWRRTSPRRPQAAPRSREERGRRLTRYVFPRPCTKPKLR